jgi:hypothetical protein
MDVRSASGFTMCLWEVRILRYSLAGTECAPVFMSARVEHKPGQYNQDTTRADRYGRFLLKEGPSNPIPPLKKNTPLHKEKQHYQQDQRKNRPL